MIAKDELQTHTVAIRHQLPPGVVVLAHAAACFVVLAYEGSSSPAQGLLHPLAVAVTSSRG
jgi:hypothetical protein